MLIGDQPRQRRGPRTGLVVAVVALALTAWCSLMASAPIGSHLRPVLPELARNLSSGLFLAAGAAHLGRWHITRDWAYARNSLALLVLGTSLSTNAMLAAVFGETGLDVLGAPEPRLLFVVPWLLLAAANARRNARLARQSLAVFALTCGAVAIVVGLLTTVTTEPAMRLPLLWQTVEIVTIGVWATLTWQTWQRARLSTASSLVTWSVLGLGLMVIADLIKLWGLTDVHAVHGLSSGFQLAAAALAAVTATVGLVRCFTLDSEVGTALSWTRQRLDHLEQVQQQRLHDARSAVLGVKGASSLLGTASGPGAPDADTLRRLVGAELDRLQSLLDLEWTEQRTEFDLGEALAPVIAAHRCTGLRVDTDLAPLLCAVGRPRTTATVVDNLLRNAACHAPGAQVRVTVARTGDRVELVIEDDGPGIPRPDRSAVLLRGVRGRHAVGDGSGLGLSGAVAAMADQGGSLSVGERRGGGTRVRLALPAAVRADDDAMAS